MQDGLTATYGSVADELKAEVAPVGEAWRLSYDRRPKLNLHARDGSHASPAGAYLAACVFYGTLLDKSPEGSPVMLKGVTKDNAAFLQKTAVGSDREVARAKEREEGGGGAYVVERSIGAGAITAFAARKTHSSYSQSCS